jgi:hypothetical protein
MAKIVLKDAFVSVDGNDISDHVSQVTLGYEADAVEKTAMGALTHNNIGGTLKNWSVEAELHSNYAAAALDSILFPLVGTEVAVIVRADKTAGVGASNPNYTGQGIVTSYPPIGGAVGDLATSSVSIVPAGDLTRATV